MKLYYCHEQSPMSLSHYTAITKRESDSNTMKLVVMKGSLKATVT